MLAAVCMSSAFADEKEIAMTKCSKPAIDTGVPVRERREECEIKCPEPKQADQSRVRMGAAKRVTEGKYIQD